MNNYQITELDNKVRVVSEQLANVRSVSLGIWVRVGSRYENAENNGITHFIEHMLFKGTTTRSARAIAEEIDAMGGQINAFTAKEYTCYYVRLLGENVAQGVDILADMLLNSCLDSQEVDKERSVITEEIKMYADAPDELANDLFNQLLWPDHPLGRPILGSEETLANIDAQALREYMQAMYTGSNIVIAAAGSIDHALLVDLAEKYFGSIPAGAPNQPQKTAPISKSVSVVNKDTEQVQLCLGVAGIANDESDEQYALSILNAYLGGSMSSCLVQKVREEMAMAYSIYSYISSYSDCGLFGFAVATRPDNAQAVVDAITAELKRVAAEGLSEAELARVLGQFKGNLYLAAESVSSRMNRLGRSLMYRDEVISVEETINHLEKITPEMLRDLAAKLFLHDDYVLLALGEPAKLTL